jgi:hypothetical protein
MRSGLSITSEPAGAQVYLDGALVGSSPVQVPAVSFGQHFMRVERAGYRTQGKFIDVSGQDQQLGFTLAATPAYQGLRDDKDRLAEALSLGDAGLAARWGKKLGLERMVVGLIREPEPGFNEVLLTLLDVSSGQRLGSRKMSFHDSAYGQLKAEVARAVTALVNEAGGSGGTKSKDPLDNRHGTETWSAEDRGGRSQKENQNQKKGDDPLNHRSGTEGW